MGKKYNINMRLKKFEQSNENKVEKGISVYKLWVVCVFRGSDIEKVYINHKDAIDESVRMKAESYQYYRKVNKQLSDEEFDGYFENDNKNKFKVIDLDTAIDIIKDEIRDDFTYDSDSY